MSAPRLLDKRTINTSVANEKKQLIETGLKLARSVDALRETKVEEEGRLDTFRKETIKVVQQEIDQFIAKRESLREEVRKAEEELKVLKLPLNPEWEKIKEAYLKYHESVEALESAKETVARQLGENAMKMDELQWERKKLDKLKLTTEENYGNSKLLLENAREESAKQRNLAQAVLSSAELREQIIIQRESDFYQERDKERARLKEWEIELNKRDQETVMEQLIRSSPITKL